MALWHARVYTLYFPYNYITIENWPHIWPLQMENITNFTSFCEAYGMPKTGTFQTVDLYEGRNMAQVLNCIQQLGTEVRYIMTNSISIKKYFRIYLNTEGTVFSILHKSIINYITIFLDTLKKYHNNIIEQQYDRFWNEKILLLLFDFHSDGSGTYLLCFQIFNRLALISCWIIRSIYLAFTDMSCIC